MKKIKKAVLLAMIMLLSTMLFACGEEKLSLKTIVPTESNVRMIGRNMILNDTLWLVHSGSGAEFTFLGTSAAITLQADSTILGSRDSQARFAIYVNGELVVDDMMNQMTKTYTVFESETEEQCTVKIVKLSEAAQSTMGITSIEVNSIGDIAATGNKEKLIEFIGDSITCGYGVEDENRDHHFKTGTENATRTYAYKTAELLDTDYSFVSYSGFGIVSGYTATKTKVFEQTVPQYYDKVGFSYNAYMGEKPSDYAWDFTKRQPDVIVVNLGTNDDSYTGGDASRKQEYVDGYIAFLKQIRQNNPDATIFCTLGIMGDGLFASVSQAMESYKAETGDTNVYAMKFDVQSAADGYAADWHPTEATHTKAAEKLAAEIQKVMGW